MRKVELEQGSDDWLKWRKGLITATEASSIMGCNKYATCYQSWQRKTGLMPEQQETDAMRRGKKDEPIAREMFIKEYGINMRPECVESTQYNFIGASLDGISDCGKYLLEVKSQRPVDIVPLMHMCQMQHQLLATDNTAKMCFYVSHWEGVNKTFEVYPDLDWQKEYLIKAKDYWKCVVFHEAPDLTDKDYKDMNNNIEWQASASQYKYIDEQIKSLLATKEAIKDQLVTMCGDESCSGAGISIMKKTSKGRIDYAEAVEELNIHADLLEHYRKPPSTSWTVTIDRKYSM